MSVMLLMCPLPSFSRNRTSTEITCTTPNVMSVGSGPIVIQIDNEVIQNGGVHSKNEGVKHIPTQYDSDTFSFHTMGMKEAFILI